MLFDMYLITVNIWLEDLSLCVNIKITKKKEKMSYGIGFIIYVTDYKNGFDASI